LTTAHRDPCNPPASLPSVITFGKYNGRLVEEVLADDPQYLQWLTTRLLYRLSGPLPDRNQPCGVPEGTPEHNALQVKIP
jgi:hypothetical protein